MFSSRTTNSGANIPTGSSATGSLTTPRSSKSPTSPKRSTCATITAAYTGDREFIRDDDAQKAFSKLRSSQAGMYAWRLGPQLPAGIPPKNRRRPAGADPGNRFCLQAGVRLLPLQPGSVFRYVNFLLQFNRLDDALIVAQTCLKLDPYNDQATDLLKSLEGFQSARG